MRIVILNFFLAVVTLFPVSAPAGTIREYSADMVDVATNRVVQKMYVTDQKMRFDTFDDRGTLESISIIRVDQGVMYALQQDKTYLTIPLDNKHIKTPQDIAEAMGMKPDITRETLGTETVGGYAAKRVKVTVAFTAGTRKIEMSHEEWLAPEFNMPVRVQDPEDKKIAEMRNIKTGAPDAAVFEIPDGYTKNAQMEEIMKRMSGGRAATR